MGFFKTLGEGYKVMGQEAKQKIVDNRSNIFTSVSVIGTFASSIISAIAGARSARQIDAEAAKLQRELTLKEKAKLCWKNFIAPAGTTIGAAGGAITSRVIDSNDISRLTKDVTIISRAYSEFKKASNEVLTEKQQQEVKEKIAEETRKDIRPGEFDNLPNPGGYELPQLFVDGFDKNVKFISTVDRIHVAVANLRTKMAQLKPRVRYGYSPTVNGVKWTEWLKEIKYETSIGTHNGGTLYENYGWNKGYLDEDGTCTDDEISFYLSPGETEYQGQKRSCYIIVWDQDPSDMRLGDILKNSTI